MRLDQMYQEIILDHYKHPHGRGLREPYGAEVHHVNPTCGDGVTLRVHLKGFVVQLHAETVQRHLQEILPLARVEITAGAFEVVNGVAVIAQKEPSVFAAGIDLQRVAVPVEVRRRDLNPFAVHLTERGFVAKPGAVVVQKLFDLGYAHENSPCCILYGPVMLQCCKKASQVENKSSVLV